MNGKMTQIVHKNDLKNISAIMVALSKTKLYMKRIQSKDSVWLKRQKLIRRSTFYPKRTIQNSAALHC